MTSRRMPPFFAPVCCWTYGTSALCSLPPREPPNGLSGGNTMKRLAALGLLAVTTALATPMAAQQKGTAPPLDIRTLSTRPELVSGGDVLIQIPPSTALGAGGKTLTAKNLIVRVNGKEISTAFRTTADSRA